MYVERVLPAKNKEARCQKEGRAAADGTGSAAGGRRAAGPGPGGAADAAEQPGQRGAQQGEARAPHPGGRPEVGAVVTSGSRVTVHFRVAGCTSF